MVKSPIKIIDSGTAPTTENLGEGQIAFGTVDGATKLYGSDGTTVTDLTTSGGQGPQGPQGEPGAPGAAATVTVGTTTTGEAGTEAAVTNSGTTSAAVLNFTIPKGAKGDKGEKGDTGSTGPAGTTTFAGLTDQPTDNAALKTALDAKANQTTVDSLTATVNGKVSSVTAGKGISITGSATAPVVNGMIAVPDYKNAQSIIVPEEGWAAPDNGVIFRVFANNSVVSTSLLRLSIAAAGGPQDFTYVAEVDKSAGVSTRMPVVVPVAKGDTIFFSATGAVSASFAPYKFVEIS